jgi:hypothetical protein
VISISLLSALGISMTTYIDSSFRKETGNFVHRNVLFRFHVATHTEGEMSDTIVAKPELESVLLKMIEHSDHSKYFPPQNSRNNDDYKNRGMLRDVLVVEPGRPHASESEGDFHRH